MLPTVSAIEIVFDPSPEDQIIVVIDAAVLRQAERMTAAREHCDPDDRGLAGFMRPICVPSKPDIAPIDSGIFAV